MSDWDDVGLPEGWRLRFAEETDSTNDEIRRCSDHREGLVIVTERQTAGRGRRGAAWLSSPGESLTFSVLLRPVEAKALWPRLSLVAGLSVAEALEKCGIEARIKWPNDVLVGKRKICGILVEAVAEHVIVGIGLNVGTTQFPDSLEATSMRLESNLDWQRPEVLTLILRSLNGWSGEIGAGFEGLLERVRERCALAGKNVCLMNGERAVEGRVIRIGDTGELVVESGDGVESFLQAHEVRVVD